MEKPEIERRFLLRPGFSCQELPSVLQREIWTIHQIYLTSIIRGERRRLRWMWQGDDVRSMCYFLTTKRSTESMMTKMEDEREITVGEFSILLHQADPDRDEIAKYRTVFWWNGQEFELDEFRDPDRLKGLRILEIELKSEDQKVELPPFLPVEREVTHVKGYSNADLAKRPT